MKRTVLYIFFLVFFSECISVPKFEDNKQSIDCYYQQKEIEWKGEKRFIYQIPTIFFYLAFGFGNSLTASVISSILKYSSSMFLYGELRVYLEKRDWISNGCKLDAK